VAAAIRAFRRSCRSPLVTSLAAQLEAFAEVVRGGRSERLATAADGLAAMLVLDAARESARSGDPSWRAVPAPAA
jgi:predicted dehydrogenase